MLCNLDEFQKKACDFFSENLIFKSSQQPANLLTEGEKEILETRGNKNSFLLGRSALKPLCNTLGISDDTSSIHFPNPRISLTHCDNHAIAVGVRDFRGLYKGIGIDLESTIRKVGPEHALHLLNDKERELYGGLLTTKQIIQFWTIKEACFKADDASQVLDFRNYSVDMTKQVVLRGGRSFSFYTQATDFYCLTLALRI